MTFVAHDDLWCRVSNLLATRFFPEEYNELGYGDIDTTALYITNALWKMGRAIPQSDELLYWEIVGQLEAPSFKALPHTPPTTPVYTSDTE